VNKLFILFFIVVTLASCNDTQDQNSSAKIASVGSVSLYEDELLRKIPKALNSADSLKFIEQFIHNWTKEQVILQKAEEVLSEESKNVKERLENYRRSLIIHSYEQAYIENRLDTLIEETEIEDYYQEHIKDFTLKGYIIKGYYAQFPDSIDQLELKEWYQLKKPEDYITLQSFSQINAVTYHLDTTNWIYFDKVMEKIPLENNIHISSFIKHKKQISFEENKTTYYLNVIDYKLKDEASPLVFEKEKIKTIILNQRTQKLRQELNENLYKDALNKQQIIIYNKK
jgi:hypothetical protein